MFVGHTLPDPDTGVCKEAWATWILSYGTFPGGLLKRCVVWDGPGHGSKQLNITKVGLDITTVPDGLLDVDPNSNEIFIALKTNGRDEWVLQYGLPRHLPAGLTYSGTMPVYVARGGR